MIKITKVASLKNNAPKLFLIPGGPGLSSLTLRSLDILKRSFDLLYIDFPGTNDNPYQGKKSFVDLSVMLSDVIKNYAEPKYVLGHSFGGFFAADIFINELASGLVCISTPFSERSLCCANDQYLEYATEELLNSEQNWLQNKDDASFAKWLSSYGDLYFKNSSGKELILNDKVSSLFFTDNRSDATSKDFMLSELKKNDNKKIFICGMNDKLLLPTVLAIDARDGGFSFFSIKNSTAHLINTSSV